MSDPIRAPTPAAGIRAKQNGAFDAGESGINDGDEAVEADAEAVGKAAVEKTVKEASSDEVTGKVTVLVKGITIINDKVSIKYQ